MRIRLGFCWLSSSFVLTGTRFGGAVAKIYQGVLGLAFRILDDDLGSPGHPGG